MIPFTAVKELLVCGVHFDCIIEGEIDHQREELGNGIPEAYSYDKISMVSVYDYAESQYCEVEEPLKGVIARVFEASNKASDIARGGAPCD